MMSSAEQIDPPQQALYLLERALDADGTRHDVSEAFENAAGECDSIPPLLAFRAKERIAAERMMERRRLIFAVLGVVAVFGTIVGGFGLTSLEQQRSLRSTEHEFSSLVDGEQWEEASAFLDRLGESVRSEPFFVEGAEQVEQAIQAEEERSQSFEKLSRQLQATPPSAWKRSDVRSLQQLAKTEQEVSIAQEIAAKSEEQQLRTQASRTDQQTAKLEQIGEEIEAFLARQGGAMTDDARLARKQELVQKLNAVMQSNSLSNPELTAMARQQLALLSQESRKDAKRQDRESSINQITASVGDQGSFLKAIDEFRSQNADDVLAKELGAHQRTENTLQSTIMWIELIDDPAFQQSANVTAEEALSWSDRYDQVNIDHSSHPLSREPARWNTYYQAISSRGDLINQLDEELGASILSPMFVYPEVDGTLHYSSRAPNAGSLTPHVVDVYQDLALRTKKKNFGLDFKEQILPNVRPASHSVFAKRSREYFGGMNVREFTPVIFRMIDELRQADNSPALHPVFKAKMLRRLLQIASIGSVPIRESFEDWRRQLDNAPIDWKTNWISPNQQSVSAVRARQSAESTLGMLDGWDAKVQKMLALFRQFRAPRDPAPRWVGWVSRDSQSHYALLAQDPGNDPLFAFVSNPSNGQVEMVPINRGGDSMKIRVTDPSAQFAGAMICAVSGGQQ